MAYTAFKLLLIDEKPIFQQIFKEIFSPPHFEVFVCNSAKESLSFLKNNTVNFICSSYYLPDMNGIELCQCIREQFKERYNPFVLLTIVTDENTLQDALPAGVTDIFHRDDLNQLLAFINRFPFAKQQISGKILYVEDDLQQQHVAKAMLAQHGLEVTAFSSGEDAWQSFLKNDYDIVITDIVLAGKMSGLVFSNHIRRLIGTKGDTPILAVTAFDDKIRRIELFNMGVTDYIVKPLFEEDLICRVNNILQKNSLQTTSQEQALASLIYTSSSEAMFVLDENEQIIATNPAFTEITGYSQVEVFGKNPSFLSTTENHEKSYQFMWQRIENKGSWSGEIWGERKNGDAFINWLTVNSIYSTKGELQKRIAIFSDITEQKNAEAIILKQANFDDLTNLPNRRLFKEYLKLELKKAERTEKPLALLFIDLDHFKDVNDTHGHDIGDKLLIEASKRINACVRNSDTVSRIGGDEFTVILPELVNQGNVDKIALSILETLQKPFIIDKNKTFISASIGITLSPNDTDDLSCLLKYADQAMYKAKSSGRNQFCYFTRSMQEHAHKKQALLKDLHAAIANHEFELYFQPIINCKNKKIEKAEALIRWHHPVLGMIPPNDFIPLAEESGLIVDIGNWVFKQATLITKDWVDNFSPNFKMSINKSPVQFQRSVEHDHWFDHIENINLDPHHLVIEITEGILLEGNNQIIDKLIKYREIGIKISMDDFGTGYSSLAYLQKFSIDYLKIDKSFIDNIAKKQDDSILTEAILAMAHKLGIQVIAEGVETIEQHDLLISMGCDYIQGYFISKPIPADAFTRSFLQNKHSSN